MIRGTVLNLVATFSMAYALTRTKVPGRGLIQGMIVVPLSMPAIAAFTLFFAVHHWNTRFNALIYISDTRKWTNPFLQKHFAKGVMLGWIEG